MSPNSKENYVNCNSVPLRDNTMDIVAGILIVRMILGHYMSMCELKNTYLFESTNILFFYMPWFFYKSGMFCSKERKEPGAFLKNNTRKFIIPFVCFSVFGTVMAILSAMITDSSIVSAILGDCRALVFHGSTKWSAPLWFLITLFLVRVLFNYVRDFVNHYFLIAVLLMTAYAHFLYLANQGVYWIGNLCSGLIFYILGMKLKEIQYRKSAFFVSLVVIGAITIFTPPYLPIVTMFGNFLLYEGGKYLLWYPFCLAGIIVFNNFVKYIGRYLKHYHFSDVGHHSMIYYVIHYPFGLLICVLYEHYSDRHNSWELLVYLCAMWLTVLPLLTYLFNTKRMSKFIGL